MHEPDNRMFPHARVMSGRLEDRLHAVAICGVFLIITAIVFGTLSYHPF